MLFGPKKCIIYANWTSLFLIKVKMVLDFTNMPKNKQQFDDFEQEEEVIKGKIMKRKARESDTKKRLEEAKTVNCTKAITNF